MEDNYSLRYFKRLTDVIHLYGAKASIEISVPGVHTVHTPGGVKEYGVNAGMSPLGNEVLELAEDIMLEIARDHAAVTGPKGPGSTSSSTSAGTAGRFRRSFCRRIAISERTGITAALKTGLNSLCCCWTRCVRRPGRTCSSSFA